MAQALRTVWLEPEEQQDANSPLLRPRRKRSAAPALWQRPLAALVGMAVLVTVITVYISVYASIARYDFQRQTLQQDLAQLDRECVQLRLELDRISAQPELMRMAQAQGLENPSADRVHYVRVTSDLPRSTTAQVPPATGQRSWFARSSRQLVATMDGAFQRFSHGPGDPAYAQE